MTIRSNRFAARIGSSIALLLATVPLLGMAQVNIITEEGQTRWKNYTAEIRRTSMGVPHIKASTWGEVGYGYGFAQAEDNLCTMADAFLTYRGERSLYLGADALPLAAGTLEMAANLDSDFFHRHVITNARLAALSSAQTSEMRDLVTGFAAGYNRYLRQLKSSNNSAHSA